MPRVASDEHRRSPLSVIIPTLATAARGVSLYRAIRSASSEQTVPALPIVVVNGDRYDTDLLARLKADSVIRVHYQPEGNLLGAVAAGRGLVDTPFFCTIDDDDRFMPWALGERLAVLRADSRADAAISWGLRETDDGIIRSPLPGIVDPDDPLFGLMHGNWLASCAGLFRTETVTADFFDPRVRQLHWTSVALRLVLERRVRFVENDWPHYFIANTPGSGSKAADYARGVRGELERLLGQLNDRGLRRSIRVKLAANCHTIAGQAEREGRLAAAWSYHLRSLTYPTGLRYLASTRHLMKSSLRALVT